eukprot:GILI01030746.1.p1 GENE.GILI01030746.1~~GILI01030746.1.p1  ORF type:complete len:285 (+),score=29.56 GILI01030746.1:49-903(+)
MDSAPLLTSATFEYVGDLETMFMWGDSNVIDPTWVPPHSILGSPNNPRGLGHLTYVLILFTVLWCVLTLALRKYYHNRTDAYVSRVVSLIHSVASFAFSGYCCFLRYQQSRTVGTYLSTFTCLAEPPLADEQYNALLSSSYFIMDTLGIIFGSYYDPMFIAHHAAAVIAINAGIFTGTIGPEMAVGLFLLEGSNPFLHLRWLLQAEKFDLHFPDSFLWQFINNGFYISFILARQVAGSLSAYNFLLCMWVPWYIRVIGVGYWAFSLKFLLDILKMDRKGERWMQ